MSDVNFDNGVVSNSDAQAAQVAEASANNVQDTTIGNVVHVGEHSEDVGVESNVEESIDTPPMISTIDVVIHVTLNTGLTFLKGLKALKSVDINSQGVSTKYNFYNPFVRSDRDRNTGEGLLRTSLGNMAKIAHSVLGREVVYIGSGISDMQTSINDMVNFVRQTMENNFPLRPNDKLFDVTIALSDGSEVVRPVLFRELFAVKSWTSTDVDKEACVTTHTVNFNISLNVGAVYDSSEPNVFVGKTVTFLASQLKALGVNEIVEYHVNYAFDSTNLQEAESREILDIMVNSGYNLISKSAVTAGRYNEIPSDAVDSLFGCGCDLILSSPWEDEPNAE
jgi:hypothetical protein